MSYCDITKNKFILPNGRCIKKNSIVIALYDPSTTTNDNKLPDKFINKSIYYKTKPYSKEQLNNIAQKIFSNRNSGDLNTFINYFNFMSKFSSQSETSEMYTLDDIRRYRSFTIDSLRKIANPSIQDMVLLYKNSKVNQIIEELKSVGINNPIFKPNFFIKDSELNASTVFPMFSELSMNINKDHIEKSIKFCNKINNSLTLMQRRCLLFLMCSVLSNQASIVSGPTASDKTFIIKCLAKLLGEKLVIIDGSKDCFTLGPLLSDGDYNTAKKCFNSLFTDSNLKYKIEQIIDVDNQATWTSSNLYAVIEILMSSKENKRKFMKEINILKFIRNSNKDDTPLNKAIFHRKWVLIENIQSAAKEFIKNITTLYYIFSNHRSIVKENNFRLFITYDPSSNGIKPSILNKFATFYLPPIDDNPISSQIALYGQSNSKIDIELWNIISARLANVHEFAKLNTTGINGYTLMNNVNMFNNSRNFSIEDIAKLLSKCLYFNYCINSKDRSNFYKQLQNELTKEMEIQNYNLPSNKEYFDVLESLYDLQINKNNSKFNFQNFIEKVYQYKFIDTNQLYFHICDTLNQLNSIELINKFGSLTLLRPIIKQMFDLEDIKEIEQKYYQEVLSNEYFSTNPITYHSIAQINLLQTLIKNDKFVDFTPAFVSSPESVKSLNDICELLEFDVNFNNLLTVLVTVSKDSFLSHNSSILLNCELIRTSKFSSILKYLPMLNKLVQNQIQFTMNNLTPYTNEESDYIVDFSFSKDNFELNLAECKISQNQKKVEIDQSKFYSAVWHLIKCKENKTNVDFSNINVINYEPIDNNNHPLFNLFPDDNKSTVLKLFKASILIENPINNNLSILFGQFEVNLMILFNSIWNSIDRNESNFVIDLLSVLDENEHNHPNMFSIINYEYGTSQRFHLISDFINIIDNFNKSINPNNDDKSKPKLSSILTNWKVDFFNTETKYLKFAADKGNVKAMMSYAWRLENGIGCSVNKEESHLYYKKAAEKGNIRAINSFAWYSEHYIDHEKYKKEALEHYKKLSEDSYRYASEAHKAGILLENDGNYKEAFKYYKRAADMGDIFAMYKVGRLFEEHEELQGKHVGQIDEKHHEVYHKAYGYYERAYEKGGSEYIKFDDERIDYKMNRDKEKADAFHYYKIAADKGQVAAIYKVGQLFETGEGVSMNKSEAFRYYKMAHNKGFIEATFKVAQMLDYGEGVSMNKSEAVNYYKIAADNGNSLALWIYCHKLEYGEGCSMNKQEAFRYYKKLADTGDTEAMNTCGWMLESGIGVQQDMNKAYQIYKEAADKGDRNANYKIGRILDFGQLGQINRYEAFKYYKKAYLMGLKSAQYIMKNVDCKEYFGLKPGDASDIDCTDEMSELSAKYYIERYLQKLEADEMKERENEKEKTLFDYEIEASRGDQNAINEYNSLYEYKECYEMTPEEAFAYNKIASNNGSAISMYKTALMLETGEGVQMNKEEAFNYYKMSADKGLSDAMYKVGQMLEKGEGVQMNKEEAFNYYEKAANNGESKSLLKMAMLFDKGWNGVEINKEKAYEYYSKLAKEGNTNAMLKSALIYENLINDDYKQSGKKIDELYEEINSYYDKINKTPKKLKKYSQFIDEELNRQLVPEKKYSKSFDSIMSEQDLFNYFEEFKQVRYEEKQFIHRKLFNLRFKYQKIKDNYFNSFEKIIVLHSKIFAEKLIIKKKLQTVFDLIKAASNNGNLLAICKYINRIIFKYDERVHYRLYEIIKNIFHLETKEEALQIYKKGADGGDVTATFFYHFTLNHELPPSDHYDDYDIYRYIQHAYNGHYYDSF